MKYHKKVTAKLIAKELNISIATVDRALNNRGNVKKETYNKILKKAEELNYTPNKLASFLSRKKEYSIALVFPEYPTYFWSQVEIGIMNAFNELRDYGLDVELFKLPDEDEKKGLAIINDIIQKKEFDALGLAAGEDIFVELIDRAMDAGLPVCTFNHDSPSSRRLFYVGSDYRNAGRLAAELLCKFIGMAGKVAILKTSDKSSYQNLEKVAGFREILAEYSEVELVDPLMMGRMDTQESLDKVATQLKTVDGIYAANAELGNVAKYLETINEKNKVLIGHDLNEMIRTYLNKNVITATIDQDPVNQGYLTVKKLFNQLTKQADEKEGDVITKLEIITRENAKFYME